MGMGYGMGKTDFMDERRRRLEARYGSPAELVKKWREDVAGMYESGATDDSVIEHIAIARAHDADELEKAIAPKKKGGRPKGSKNKVRDNGEVA